jgi:competence protein ComEC
VPHHGSRTSNSEAFVSAGRENPFGYPHPAVIQRLRDAGAQVWRTGEVGAVSVCTDGRAVRLETAERRVVLY